MDRRPDEKLDEGLPRIDFLIVGAAKSGTTSLHRYLGQHPEIFLPKAKELAFFIAPLGDPREREFLREYYADVRPGQTVGLSEANMLMFPHVPERVRAHNPRAKVVAVLRHPVERAYSAYWFARLRGWDSSETFEEALERELRGELTSHHDRINFTYLEHGHYAEQLESFQRALGGEQVRAVLMEALRDEPRETLSELLLWLGVSPRLDRIRWRRHHNVTSRVRFEKASRLLAAFASPFRRLARGVLPWSLRHRLRASLRPLRRWNRVPFTPPPMSPVTRQRLVEYYGPHNRELSSLLGWDLSHWR